MVNGTRCLTSRRGSAARLRRARSELGPSRRQGKADVSTPPCTACTVRPPGRPRAAGCSRSTTRHWEEAPSLRWLSHLAARIDGPAGRADCSARERPDQPRVIGELEDYPACVRLGCARLAPRRPPRWPGRGSATGRPELLPGGARVHRVQPVPLDASSGGASNAEVTGRTIGGRVCLPSARSRSRDARDARIGAVTRPPSRLAGRARGAGRPAPLRHVGDDSPAGTRTRSMLHGPAPRGGRAAAGATARVRVSRSSRTPSPLDTRGRGAMAHARAAALLDKRDGARNGVVARN